MLPVQTHGWYRGLSGVLSQRQTRQMSEKQTLKLNHDYLFEISKTLHVCDSGQEEI